MRKLPLILTLAVLLVCAQRASAIINVNAIEDSGNVVFSFTGSFNRDSGTLLTSLYGGGSAIFPLEGTVTFNTGVPSEAGHNYELVNFTGPTSFGTSFVGSIASSHSGEGFLFSSTYERLFVQQTYGSGDPFSGSMTFNSSTFASLGLNTGIYDWSWSNSTTGASDSLRLTIGSASVPDTGTTVALLGLALTGLAFVRRRFA